MKKSTQFLLRLHSLLLFFCLCTFQNANAQYIKTFAGGAEDVHGIPAYQLPVLNRIYQIATDADGNLYVSTDLTKEDYVLQIVKVDRYGLATRFMGSFADSNIAAIKPFVERFSSTSSQLSVQYGFGLDRNRFLYAYGTFYRGDKPIAVDSTKHIHSVDSVYSYGISGYGEVNFTLSGLQGTVVYDRRNRAISLGYYDDVEGSFILSRDSIGRLDTIAGIDSRTFTPDGTSALAASLGVVRGMTIDSFDNIYYVDSTSKLIRKIDVHTHLISTVAGSTTSTTSGLEGVAATSTAINPAGLAIDRWGNIYFHDRYDDGNYRLRKIDTFGVLHTVAGGGIQKRFRTTRPTDIYYTTSDYSPLTEIACGRNGEVFWIAKTEDYAPPKIYKYSGDTVYRYMGIDADSETNGIKAEWANLDVHKVSKLVSFHNEMYNVHQNGSVSKFDLLGRYQVLIDSSNHGYAGDGDSFSHARFNGIGTFCIDSSGNMFVWDAGNYRIRKISNSGIVTTIAGNGTGGYTGDGGAATDARLESVQDIQVDRWGNIYLLTDFKLRKITASGSINTILGEGAVDEYTDGMSAADCSPLVYYGFSQSLNLAVDTQGNVYFSSFSGSAGGDSTWMTRIFRLDTSGVIHVVAGKRIDVGHSFAVSRDSIPDVSDAMSTLICLTSKVSCDARGNIYFSDRYQEVVKQIDASGTVRTIIGKKGRGVPYWDMMDLYTDMLDYLGRVLYWGDGGRDTNAILTTPDCITTDMDGNIYVYDYWNFRIRERVNCPSYYSTLSISSTDTICAGATTIATTSEAHGDWTTSDAAIATTDASNHIHATSAGTATITYSVDGICGVVKATKNITVLTAPSSLSISGDSVICAGTTVGLTGSIAGGTWSTAHASLATVSSTGMVTAVTTGIDTVYYTVSNSCGSLTASGRLIINSRPHASAIGGVDSICIGAFSTFADSITGGAWSLTDASVGTLSATGGFAGASSGTSIIRYSLSNDCGTDTAVRTVTVVAPPHVSAITGADSVCEGSTTVLSDSVTTGSWSVASTSIASISTTGTASGISAGSTLVTYTSTNMCGTASSTHAILVNPLPRVSVIAGSDSVCEGSAITLTDSVSGGTWSISGSGIATIGSTGIVTGSALGSATVTYSYTNSCGSTEAHKTVTVNPLPHAGAITGTDSVCAGSSITMYDSVSGGVWSIAGTGVASVSTTGVVTGISHGLANVTYLYTNSCGSATATKTVRVNLLPYVSLIAGTDSVCIGSTVTLTDSTSGGTWSITSSGAGTISTSGVVSGVSTGSVVVTYSYTNSCGTATTSRSIRVNPLPYVSAITGRDTVCEGSAISLTDSVGSGSWSSASSAIANVSASGVVSGVAHGTTLISYSFTNSCGSATATHTVVVNPLPHAGTIVGSGTLCAGDSIPLFDSAFGGVWIVIGGHTTISSTGIATGYTGGIDTVLYVVTNSCGTDTASFNVAVGTVTFAGVLTGTDSVCIDSATVFADTVTGGAWSSLGSAVHVSTTGVITAFALGIDTIRYTITSACGTTTASKAIVVYDCHLGISTPAAGNGIDIFPNPTNGKVTVSAQSVATQMEVSISDVSGKELVHKLSQKSSITFDVTSFASGVYLVRTIVDGVMYNQKIVVQ